MVDLFSVPALINDFRNPAGDDVLGGDEFIVVRFRDDRIVFLAVLIVTDMEAGSRLLSFGGHEDHAENFEWLAASPSAVMSGDEESL
ncbi:MAG: hypothetical protein JWN64_128 [Parcubacteria group bacterium]|nr:hypothetical protein [Parcubacteria group bacterium]